MVAEERRLLREAAILQHDTQNDKHWWRVAMGKAGPEREEGTTRRSQRQQPSAAGPGRIAPERSQGLQASSQAEVETEGE